MTKDIIAADDGLPSFQRKFFQGRCVFSHYWPLLVSNNQRRHIFGAQWTKKNWMFGNYMGQYIPSMTRFGPLLAIWSRRKFPNVDVLKGSYFELHVKLGPESWANQLGVKFQVKKKNGPPGILSHFRA